MSSDEAAFLEAAAELADRIAKSAIWFDGRCNWIAPVPRTEFRSSADTAVQTLGPDLYGGTAGVAVFLAEAALKLDEPRFRAAALGAARQALRHRARTRSRTADGLYEGSVGIAYAATRVAAALGEEELAAGAHELLQTWRQHETLPASSDVMSGCAGAVVGLAALTEPLAESWVVDAATTLGDELIARAEPGRGGFSWPAQGPRAVRNLCGYAHGTSGVAHALLELFELTGDPRFARVAQGAFDYERSWLDHLGTWADLRGVGREARSDAPLSGTASWCNGASGILLARLRATDLSPSADVTTDAEVALATCEQHAMGLLAHAPGDFSLCHGVAGIGDALLEAAQGPDDPCVRLAAELGRWGIEHARGEIGRFPCGLLNGETPGLHLGLAGIGLFFLRLADPDLESALLVRRKRLTAPIATT